MRKQLGNASRWRLKNMRFLLYPFRWPEQSSQSSLIGTDETATRALVARLAKGNVLLQAGRYQTQDQLNERADRMSAHRFIDNTHG
ncbi:hypothetical protein U5801_23940 [Lamprobacter modestohalophilus]|jgi:hypothetical protein|uniref:hypothetical protein n=1 Tax=Lamprobacter modestohalophilus TaxID=1064514 RepID=UPI002ADEB2CB|nr:hypothetical protein [Lamprobacter modestohalophilus]MEA1052837.1 hypothetical protein [Lamprobacter modestohalophilus]